MKIFHTSGQQAMWDVLRVLRRPISAETLTSVAHINGPRVRVSVASALDYLTRLTRAGHLRRGRGGLYLLVRNSGPKAPQIRRNKDIYDPNTNTTYRDGRIVEGAT